VIRGKKRRPLESGMNIEQARNCRRARKGLISLVIPAAKAPSPQLYCIYRAI
jgi:hypothetical protein